MWSTIRQNVLCGKGFPAELHMTAGPIVAGRVYPAPTAGVRRRLCRAHEVMSAETMTLHCHPW